MSASAEAPDFNRLAIPAALAIGTLGLAMLLVLPGLVGALKQGYGYDELQTGYLSSGDLAGVTVGAGLGARWLPRRGLRQGARLGLALAAIANLNAVLASAFWVLLGLRVLAGLGAGVAVAGCYIVLGQSKRVDRSFSVYLICQLLFGAVALQFMPTLSVAMGIRGVFAILGALFAISVLLANYLPSSSQDSSPEAQGGRSGSAAWIGLFAILVYFIGQGAIWAYLELIGEQQGIARQAVATGLGLATLVGVLGPVMAALLGAGFGRVAPLFLGLCIGLGALYLLFMPALSPFAFVFAACLFTVAWNFSVPYQLACIAAVDRSKQVVGWSASASLGGLAIGPLVGAYASAPENYSGVLGLSAVLCIASFAGFIPALAAGEYEKNTTPVS